MLKKWLAGFLACLMLGSFACAEKGVKITEVETVIGENGVRYPQLEGMADVEIQKKINDEIVLESGVSGHLVTLITMGQNPWKLQVEHESRVLDDGIFSTVISARGKIGTQRDAHAYTALCYDLSTGLRLTMDDLFADVEAAKEKMEQIVLDSLSEELNGYLEYSDLTPLPWDSFTLDENGITFWYPADQFRLLSGWAGAAQFRYEELDGLWKNGFAPEVPAKPDAEAIALTVEAGEMPGIPVYMGQPLNEVLSAYRLLRTPDEFPGGRYYMMEDPAFRGVMVLSDALERDTANSAVEGVQLRRGGFHGLLIGRTEKDAWQAALGKPLETVQMTEGMAYDYGLSEGSCDVYHFGSRELRLYAGEDGVLFAIQLCNQ